MKTCGPMEPLTTPLLQILQRWLPLQAHAWRDNSLGRLAIHLGNASMLSNGRLSHWSQEAITSALYCTIFYLPTASQQLNKFTQLEDLQGSLRG